MTPLAKSLSTRLPQFSIAYGIYWTVIVLFIGMLIGPFLSTGGPGYHFVDDHATHLTHDHSGGHGQFDVAAELAPQIDLVVLQDAAAGWNVLIETENFRFAPEAVNQEAIVGEGHGHIYVDGEKIARLYGPAYHLSDLGPGEHVITVTLNANDHSIYAVDGEEISATVTVGGPLA